MRAVEDATAAEAALHSDRQRLTGSATAVGSVGFDETGAFDVGLDSPEAREPQDRSPETQPSIPAAGRR